MHGKVDNIVAKWARYWFILKKQLDQGGKMNKTVCLVSIFPLFLGLNIVPKITRAVTL